MRTMIKRTAGWIHATLIMAMIIPLLYAFVVEPPDAIGQTLYYKCLVIALPIMATDLAAKRCKGLLSYLALSVLVLAATSAIGRSVAGSLQQSWMYGVYMVVLLAETVFVIVSRIADRLRKKAEGDFLVEAVPALRVSFDRLSKPSFSVLIYFVSVYVIAVNLNNSAVCNAALFSAIAYTLITVLYEHVCETESYLALNRRTCNLPSKRIYGIGNGMLAIFLLLFVIIILPALFTISNRHYRDLRKAITPISEDHMDLMEEYRRQYAAEEFMEIPMELYGEPEPIPEWLDNLFYIFTAAFFLFLVAALIKFIYDTFQAFRETADENGDVVEELQETDEGIKIKKNHVRRRKLSERERIRKEYRRLIRRYRKDRPARYESPTEIERNAGIAGSEECKGLHEQYELARYGQEV